MQVIGVVDLLAGRAVHARAGCRDRYAPVRAVAGCALEPGDMLALARMYVERFGITELYAADIDAILGRAPQDAAVAAITGIGAPLWMDAGISSAERAHHALRLGVTRVIIGLETLPSYDALETICAAVGGDRVAFSLDVRHGEPILSPGTVGPRTGITPGEPAHIIASRAANAGASAVIVIDLARVGTGAGLDFGLIERVRNAVPGLTLLAGGGIRGLEDCARLADSGCDGALVATALHDGRLGAADVAATQRLRRSSDRHP